MVSRCQIKKGETVVYLVPSRSHKTAIERFLVSTCKRYKALCYATVTKPYDTLVKDFAAGNIPHQNMLFIDAITKHAGKKGSDEAANCIHVNSPSALTSLSLAIEKAIETKKFDVLVFDSISGLLVYNKKEIVCRFINDLIAKVRKVGVTCVLISEQETKQEVLADVSMFCDRTIDAE
jgi:KaiC/GvpD/RAD55 family RecA-like ATPase